MLKDYVGQDINTGDVVLYVPAVIEYEQALGNTYTWSQLHIAVVNDIQGNAAIVKWKINSDPSVHRGNRLLKISPDIRYQSNENVKTRLLSTLKLQGLPIVTEKVQWFIDYLD